MNCKDCPCLKDENLKKLVSNYISLFKDKDPKAEAFEKCGDDSNYMFDNDNEYVTCFTKILYDKIDWDKFGKSIYGEEYEYRKSDNL